MVRGHDDVPHGRDRVPATAPPKWQAHSQTDGTTPPLQDAYSLVRTARVALEHADTFLQACSSSSGRGAHDVPPSGWSADVNAALVHVRRVVCAMENALRADADSEADADALKS
jgi:hypothetical protein